uniref:Glycosyl transferase family 1 domain-containing protein n=1 Tax=viral metagenome TaxID=1070528 RepID=A0A6C0D066_9ZZZZ
MDTKIRLHLLAVPHTITRSEYSHCAFTGKVQRFSPMMRSVGFEVYHYGIESSDSGADKNFNILSINEWKRLRIESYKSLNPDVSFNEIKKKLNDHTQFIGNLANIGTPLYKVFNERLRPILAQNYRSRTTDIVCLTFGPAHEEAISGKDYITIETGIGYNNAYKELRIYESYAIMHWYLGKEGKQTINYWFICANYYNIIEWPLNLNPIPNRIGYFGRIHEVKGLYVILEIAKLFPQVEFIICGQGDPTPFTSVPNIKYKQPIHSSDRAEYLGNLTALLAPSSFLEPFCGVSAEAQLCGTPVIATDTGAFVENIEQFKTGARCHTLSDFCYAVKMALEGKFDRQYIHDRAVSIFDMYVLAKRYKYIFDSVIDIYNGTNGWYSPNVHMNELEDIMAK